MPARDHFRAHARRRVDLGATLYVSAQNRSQDVRIRNLGLGGACIEVPEGRQGGVTGLDLEELVTVQITAPTLWDPLPLRGKVAWVRRAGQDRRLRAGVRFEHRDESAIYALFQLLATQAHDA